MSAFGVPPQPVDATQALNISAGAEVFKRHFHQAKKEYWGRPFQGSATFEKACLTDLFQEMTDLGTAVLCVTIERGWKEIDTVEDYEKAVKAFKALEQ